MANNFSYAIDSRKPIDYPKIEGWNEVIVETAGFIPLAVRFKQMEQAGYRARFNESEFSSRDISDMYLSHAEFDIQPDDDLEDVIEKTELRRQYVKNLQNEILAKRAATDSEANESEAKVSKEESAAKKDKIDE